MYACMLILFLLAKTINETTTTTIAGAVPIVPWPATLWRPEQSRML